MRKRELKALDKRKRILSSDAFKYWWSHRRAVYPIPEDAYRAYRIDKGKFARRKGQKPWRRQPNRFDIEPVDWPSNDWRPSPKPSKRLPSFERLPEIVVPKVSDLSHRLQKIVEGWSEKMHVPAPIVITHKTGPLRAQYLAKFNPWGKQFYGGEIHIGTKGVKLESGKLKISGMTLGALQHEFGHHVHAAGRFFETGQINPQFEPPLLMTKEERLEKERTAWKIAEQIQKTPVTRWAKFVTLASYTGKVNLREALKSQSQSVSNIVSQSKSEPFLEVIWQPKTNPYLHHKEFPLAKAAKAFDLYMRVNASQIVLRGLEYEPSFTEWNISEATRWYGKHEQWEEQFDDWLKRQLEIWKDKGESTSNLIANSEPETKICEQCGNLLRKTGMLQSKPVYSHLNVRDEKKCLRLWLGTEMNRRTDRMFKNVYGEK